MDVGVPVCREGHPDVPAAGPACPCGPSLLPGTEAVQLLARHHAWPQRHRALGAYGDEVHEDINCFNEIVTQEQLEASGIL